MPVQRSDARTFTIRAVTDAPPIPAIRFENVRLAFAAGKHTLPALDRSSFDVPPGEITTVVGPSGCGKTTLLRLASGLIPVSGGSVFCNGSSVQGFENPGGVVTT